MTHDTEPMLREALEHLAADATAQARYLQQIGTWPSLDELALELDDVAEASESWASSTLRDQIRLLSTKLDEMSGEANADLWQPEALEGTEWEDVRALAAAALMALDEDV